VEVGLPPGAPRRGDIAERVFPGGIKDVAGTPAPEARDCVMAVGLGFDRNAQRGAPPDAWLTGDL